MTDSTAPLTADAALPKAPPVLQVKSISKTFGLARVLTDVSLDVQAGTVHAFLGHNGSGKSTVIRILAGNHRPDPEAGSVTIRGEDLTFGSPSASHKLGLRFVHQDLAVISSMTAIENLEIGTEAGAGRFGFLHGRARSERLARQRLSELGLSGEFDVAQPMASCRHVDRLTVAIARAMADLEQGGILVLDEPTAALPPHEVHTLFELIRGFVDGGGTVIYVTHRLDEILTFADAVTVLRDGVVVGTYATADLTRADLVDFSVGNEEVADVAPVMAAAPAVHSPGIQHSGPALEVRGLRSGAVIGLDLEVQPGEIIGVAGLVGSGREEVAAALVGAIPASHDSLKVAGRSVPKVTPAKALAAGLVMVPGNRQPGSRVREMSIRENFTLARTRRFRRGPFLSREAERVGTEKWIAALDVRPSDPERTFGTLSGGNQQKIIVAKWLDTKPSAAVLDESTAGVDAAARASIYGQIRESAATGVGFIVCSSDIEDLVSLCSRVVVLNAGGVACTVEGTSVNEAALMRAVFDAEVTNVS